MSKKYVRPADYIVPLNINGLEGRMIYIEADSKAKRSNLLVVYDLNSNLERWWGLIVGLRRYGNVMMSDLPGFGGMDSFYRISTKPTIDNLADYLASLIKLRYRRKKLSIVGIGFGFVIVTRMLQRNPSLASRVNIVISLNGYAHKDDLLNQPRSLFHKAYYLIGSTAIVSRVLNLVLNNSLALSFRYMDDKSLKPKQQLDNQFINRFKIDLARESDFRTSLYVARELLELNNCSSRISNKFWHISFGDKKTLNHKLLEQHLRVIYADYNYQPSKLTQNIPFVFNDDKLAIKILPAKLRRDLKKSH